VSGRGSRKPPGRPGGRAPRVARPTPPRARPEAEPAEPEVAPARRLDLDDLGVVGTGAVLVGLAFLPWYEARIAGSAVSYTAWQLGLVSILATLLAVYAAGRVLLLRGKPPKPDVPVTPAAETFVAAGAALLLLVYRAIDVPTLGDLPVSRTPFLAAAAAVALLQTVFALRKLAKVGLRA
jgi:hypothetical protein